MRRLLLLSGRADPELLELVADAVVGRHQDCDLRLFDETASRRHARVTVGEDRVELVDLGSSNGTWLNGERVTRPARLFDGDVVRIGDTELRYLSGDGADRETVVESARDGDVAASLDPEAADPAGVVEDADAVRRLRLVCDAAVACADAADGTELGSALVGLLRDALAPARAVVCLLGAGGALEVAACHPPAATAPASTTLRSRVLEGGEAVLVRDTQDAQAGPGAPSMVRSRYRSMLAAPLRVAEGVLGFVSVEAESPAAYVEADLRALAAVARQAALALRNLRALHGARAELQRLHEWRAGGAPPFLGEDPAMEQVRRLIAKAADSDAPVLISGETGTGKELVARHLHAASARAARPFVALNCAALVEGLLESELFGHEKGAFTGATERHEGRISQAADGTLFLDEVGELPAVLQAKLLRVLSEGTFQRVGGSESLPMRCRVLAATNRDLRRMVADGAFREDLYYRLQVLEIHVPPLRERPGDVILIGEASLEALAARMGRRVPRLAEDARAVLRAHTWRGNVRELLNVLERVLVLLEGDTISAADLPQDVRERRPAGEVPTGAPAEVLTVREAEKRAVRAALEHTGGKKGAAAALLGISWPTLNRKIREYGL